MKTGFSLCSFSLQGKTCFNLHVFPCYEKLHRETPVFITGMGLQCTRRWDCQIHQSHNSAIYYDLYGPLVSLLNRYTQQNNQITYTTMCIQCIHLHSLGSFYLHLPHLYSNVILYWLKTTEGFRQKSAYPLELIRDLNLRLGIQTKVQFWPLIKNLTLFISLFKIVQGA